jgi:hypothetical protein
MKIIMHYPPKNTRTTANIQYITIPFNITTRAHGRMKSGAYLQQNSPQHESDIDHAKCPQECIQPKFTSANYRAPSGGYPETVSQTIIWY